MLFGLFGQELQRHKSRKISSKATPRDIELQMEKINVFISKIDSMAWVAERFAESFGNIFCGTISLETAST